MQFFLSPDFVSLCPFQRVSLASTLHDLLWSCLPLSRSLSTLLITFIAHLHIVSFLKQGGWAHKIVQGTAGRGCCGADINGESHRPAVPIQATMSQLKQCQDPFHNLLQEKNHTTTKAHNPLDVALRPIHTDRFCRILDVLISLSRNHLVLRREGWASWKSSPFLLL